MVPFRYLKPGYVALGVTNLERSVAFYRDIVGLALEAQQGSELAFLRCSDDHHNVVLYQSAEPGIKRMAFQLETPADVPRAREHLHGLGWPVETLDAAEARAFHQGETIRFRIPGCGLMFEFYGEIDRASQRRPVLP